MTSFGLDELERAQNTNIRLAKESLARLGKPDPDWEIDLDPSGSEDDDFDAQEESRHGVNIIVPTDSKSKTDSSKTPSTRTQQVIRPIDRSVDTALHDATTTERSTEQLGVAEQITGELEPEECTENPFPASMRHSSDERDAEWLAARRGKREQALQARLRASFKPTRGKVATTTVVPENVHAPRGAETTMPLMRSTHPIKTDPITMPDLESELPRKHTVEGEKQLVHETMPSDDIQDLKDSQKFGKVTKREETVRSPVQGSDLIKTVSGQKIKRRPMEQIDDSSAKLKKHKAEPGYLESSHETLTSSSTGKRGMTQGKLQDAQKQALEILHITKDSFKEENKRFVESDEQLVEDSSVSEDEGTSAPQLDSLRIGSISSLSEEIPNLELTRKLALHLSKPKVGRAMHLYKRHVISY
ncbi:unnamed protein product [Protopolystoma xenopodis]|uniref:Uncharacterized protein n=1 Tax=Protopolystoma xenopodis TaxID=117903 RepID=A0A3S5B4I6_9PLAT|nr:unnamed protein product [Protopolystoma xenopodis]